MKNKHKAINPFMKTITLIIVLASAAIAFAGIYPLVFKGYDKSKAPTLTLPLAYDRAMSALGAYTNTFHCISATITTTFSLEGEWYFTFYSTNSNTMPKRIAVEFNGKVVLDNGLR